MKGILNARFAALVIVALGATGCAWASDLDALEARVVVLETQLANHRTASQNWAWNIKVVVDCLEKRRYNFPEDVVRRDGTVVDCNVAPGDPPTTPPPNTLW